MLPEFGDERNAGECIEGKLKALKFGPGLDIVSAKEHTGFGCHDAFLLWRQELCVAYLCHAAPTSIQRTVFD